MAWCKKHKIEIFFGVIFLVGLVILVCINYSNQDFFNMNLYQIISLVSVLVISFYLVQKMQDYRKKKEVYSSIIEKVSGLVMEIDLNSLKSDNCKIFMSKNRAIDTKITLLKKESKSYKLENEILYIEKENKEMNDLVSAHIGDVVHLETIYVDINRHKDNIQNKCDEILFKLYF